MLSPIGQNVVLEILSKGAQEAAAVKASSGLFLPTKRTEGQPDHGIVYAISASIKDPGYKLGDTVIFKTKEIFQGFKLEGKDLVSVEHEEIIAIVEVV